MRSYSRSPSSASTPAPRSPSDRPAAPYSSPPRSPASSALSTRRRRVKQAVCGYGRAEKTQVQRMVQAILRLELPRAEPCSRCARRRHLPRAGAAVAEGVARDLPPDAVRRFAAETGSCWTSTVWATCCGSRTLGPQGEPPARRSRARHLPARAGGRTPALRLRRHCRAPPLRAPALRARRGPEGRALIVSGSPPAELRRSIVLEDTARFLAIPGVGRRPRDASSSS